jgi:hypothetical protein
LQIQVAAGCAKSKCDAVPESGDARADDVQD